MSYGRSPPPYRSPILSRAATHKTETNNENSGADGKRNNETVVVRSDFRDDEETATNDNNMLEPQDSVSAEEIIQNSCLATHGNQKTKYLTQGPLLQRRRFIQQQDHQQTTRNDLPQHLTPQQFIRVPLDQHQAFQQKQQNMIHVRPSHRPSLADGKNDDILQLLQHQQWQQQKPLRLQTFYPLQNVGNLLRSLRPQDQPQLQHLQQPLCRHKLQQLQLYDNLFLNNQNNQHIENPTNPNGFERHSTLDQDAAISPTQRHFSLPNSPLLAQRQQLKQQQEQNSFYNHLLQQQQHHHQQQLILLQQREQHLRQHNPELYGFSQLFEPSMQMPVNPLHTSTSQLQQQQNFHLTNQHYQQLPLTDSLRTCSLTARPSSPQQIAERPHSAFPQLSHEQNKVKMSPSYDHHLYLYLRQQQQHRLPSTGDAQQQFMSSLMATGKTRTDYNVDVGHDVNSERRLKKLQNQDEESIPVENDGTRCDKFSTNQSKVDTAETFIEATEADLSAGSTVSKASLPLSSLNISPDSMIGQLIASSKNLALQQKPPLAQQQQQPQSQPKQKQQSMQVSQHSQPQQHADRNNQQQVKQNKDTPLQSLQAISKTQPTREVTAATQRPSFFATPPSTRKRFVERRGSKDSPTNPSTPGTPTFSTLSLANRRMSSPKGSTGFNTCSPDSPTSASTTGMAGTSQRQTNQKATQINGKHPSVRKGSAPPLTSTAVRNGAGPTTMSKTVVSRAVVNSSKPTANSQLTPVTKKTSSPPMTKNLFPANKKSSMLTSYAPGNGLSATPTATSQRTRHASHSSISSNGNHSSGTSKSSSIAIRPNNLTSSTRFNGITTKTKFFHPTTPGTISSNSPTAQQPRPINENNKPPAGGTKDFGLDRSTAANDIDVLANYSTSTNQVDEPIKGANYHLDGLQQIRQSHESQQPISQEFFQQHFLRPETFHQDPTNYHIYKNINDNNNSSLIFTSPLMTSSPQISESAHRMEAGHFDHLVIAARATQMVEELSGENKILKKELESYYRKISTLEKVEREIERMGRAYESLVNQTERRENMERIVRMKLESEVVRLNEDNKEFKGQLQHCLTQLQSFNDSLTPMSTPLASPTQSLTTSTVEHQQRRELQRKDAMLMKLLKQNHSLLSAKNELEFEASVLRKTLEEQKKQMAILKMSLVQAQAASNKYFMELENFRSREASSIQLHQHNNNNSNNSNCSNSSNNNNNNHFFDSYYVDNVHYNNNRFKKSFKPSLFSGKNGYRDDCETDDGISSDSGSTTNCNWPKIAELQKLLLNWELKCMAGLKRRQQERLTNNCDSEQILLSKLPQQQAFDSTSYGKIYPMSLRTTNHPCVKLNRSECFSLDDLKLGSYSFNCPRSSTPEDDSCKDEYCHSMKNNNIIESNDDNCATFSSEIAMISDDDDEDVDFEEEDDGCDDDDDDQF